MHDQTNLWYGIHHLEAAGCHFLEITGYDLWLRRWCREPSNHNPGFWIVWYDYLVAWGIDCCHIAWPYFWSAQFTSLLNIRLHTDSMSRIATSKNCAVLRSDEAKISHNYKEWSTDNYGVWSTGYTQYSYMSWTVGINARRDDESIPYN